MNPPSEQGERAESPTPDYESIVKAQQKNIPENARRCAFCGKVLFYCPADKAYVEGHCYSRLGWQEVFISGVCEFCFDGMFEDEDDEDL